MSLTLYGTDLSQPCRAVSWLLRYHDTPFQYEMVMPGKKKEGGTRHPEFLKMNPHGMVPVIKDGDVVVVESNAILVYLAETRKWDDVYPLAPGKAKERAAINRFLHWGHRNTRELTIALFAPLARPDIKMSPELIEEKRQGCVPTIKFLDKHLADNEFLAVGVKGPTLADFAIFADLGQCEDLALFDFAPYKNVTRWMAAMRKLKGYQETHEGIDALKPILEQAKARAKSASRTQQANL